MANKNTHYYEFMKDLTEQQRLQAWEMFEQLKKEGYDEILALKIAKLRIKDNEMKNKKFKKNPRKSNNR